MQHTYTQSIDTPDKRWKKVSWKTSPTSSNIQHYGCYVDPPKLNCFLFKNICSDTKPGYSSVYITKTIFFLMKYNLSSIIDHHHRHHVTYVFFFLSLQSAWRNENSTIKILKNLLRSGNKWMRKYSFGIYSNIRLHAADNADDNTVWW